MKEEGALRCYQCGFVVYSNPAAAVVVIVIQDKKILLAKRAIEPLKDYWDNPGGFVDFSENIEDTVIREVKEETNLTVAIEKYLSSEPDQYGPEGAPVINLFYYAKILSGEMKALDDVAELKWFSLDETPKKLAFKNTKRSIQFAKKIINEKK
ncbi:MAG: NUDIX domain-containing protein [Candidatus Woesebacteria bacterium]